jgi:hypothetical protein
MKKVVSIKKYITFSIFVFIVFFAGVANVIGSPASNPICTDLSGRAKGICVAAVAAGCGTIEAASSQGCETLAQMFTEVTGTEPNWICPCYTSANLDQAFSEITEKSDIVGFGCVDTISDTFIETIISPRTYVAPGGGGSGWHLAELWWEAGGHWSERYCSGYWTGDLNDLNISQAHACRQAILESNVWQESGCPDSSVW